MPRTIQALEHVDGRAMLTDSGIETDIIFGEGRDLPAFAAFPLLEDDAGRAILDRYYREHLAVAEEHGMGYVLETPTWRSNPDWGTSLGYTRTSSMRWTGMPLPSWPGSRRPVRRTACPSAGASGPVATDTQWGR